jgi:hypothetical protein
LTSIQRRGSPSKPCSSPSTSLPIPGSGSPPPGGAVAHVLRAHGFPVICSDIVERAFPLHFTGDFFTQSKAPAGCTTIITNPLLSERYGIRRARARARAGRLPALEVGLLRIRPPHRATRASRTSRRPCFSAPSAANAPPRLERSAQLELDCVRLVPLAPRSSRSADSQPHLNQEASNNMAIQTLTSIKRNRSRAERHRGGAARIVAKMRRARRCISISRMRGRFGPCRTASPSIPTSPRSSPVISTSWAWVTACSPV